MECLKDIMKVPGPKYDGMDRLNEESLALEKQYAQTLGRLAQLCDIVIPYLVEAANRVPENEFPDNIKMGICEIMEYVVNVRP